MQGKLIMAFKKRASTSHYISPKQLGLEGFESPFTKFLDSENRWVVLGKQIPWDDLVSIYNKQMNVDFGRPGLNPRVAIGSMIIKHLCDLSDRDTILYIQENVYAQYFLGYPGFRTEGAFDPSLFPEIRSRLGMDGVQAMNDVIARLAGIIKDNKAEEKEDPPAPAIEEKDNNQEENKGRVLYDATACPQDIAYPTDLGLLNDAREKSEALIDILYDQEKHRNKPRTYRKKARKLFLNISKKKVKHKKAVRKAIGQQLRFLRRNLSHIDLLLDTYSTIPLCKKDHKYLLVIATLYQQQKQMYEERKHSVQDRIVSIHQPHVRPMVRGKSRANTEFGSKINVSLVDGFAFLDELSWDAFNEGTHLTTYIEQYRKRFGYYPKEVLTDQIYCNRQNRKYLTDKGIRLLAKPLGRPPAVKQNHVSPGERNPIEGKFGQAKTAYGMDKIRARLKQTSQTWVAMILLVVNLVKLAGLKPHCLYNIVKSLSARVKLIYCILNLNYKKSWQNYFARMTLS